MNITVFCNVTPYSLADSNVSEKNTASMFRIEDYAKHGTQQPGRYIKTIANCSDV